MSNEPAPHALLSELHHQMLPTQLIDRCQDVQPDASHEPFCFELFRRAIAEGCSPCWHHLYDHYYPLVRYWVSQRIQSDPDTIDDLTQDAFAAFWRFYTPDKLACANGLGDVLRYLKSCAASAAAQARRRREPPQTEWDEQAVDARTSARSAEASALQRLSAQHLWAAVEACCTDDRERVVARLGFRAGLKPRHIAERRPDLFPDVSDVYRVKRNLLDRLRRHPGLQAIREKEPDQRLIE